MINGQIIVDQAMRNLRESIVIRQVEDFSGRKDEVGSCEELNYPVIDDPRR